VSQLDHFDRIAPRYDELRSPLEVTPVHEVLVREGGLEGARILDVGCGTGQHAAILADHFGCRIAGVDPSKGMLERARAKLPDADLRLGIAEQLPFDDDSFDAALTMLAVHHFDRSRAFPEIRRVLVPGGRYLLTTPDPDAFEHAWMATLFPSYVAVEQGRFPSFASLRTDLQAAGFADVRCSRHDVPRSFHRDEALAKLRGRHASTFDLLGEEEYRAGVERAERELPDRVEYTLELLVVRAER
jgi:ubiquinone/menaquinone biosynthesis C-methylase UbiE